ncbi:hypothetical protein J2744_003039 [Halorubrum trapanicum]|uniref:Uncharacterized protein n=1 Tax=Halorubrum trapanicum TaxID=29284 RepID=A0A8J7UNP3_9EURY|nr:hypothetical protein [Halorubrum trapanicum]MBP1903334.1 hypothetical protein [Halorubrum trapanicum]
MLDDIIDVLIGEVAKLVPDIVWGAVFLVTGLLTTMIGVTMVLGMTTLNGSPRLGGVLTAVGVLLIAGPLVAWYR